MSEGQQPQNRWAPFLPVGVVGIMIGVAIWWFSKPSSRVPEPVVEVPPQAAPTTAPVVAQRKPAPSASTKREYVYDLPIHPGGSATPEGPMHPHPFTPQHERIFRENYLIGQLNGAMDVKDVKGMRKLLAEYREEYPEDDHVMQQGYEIIANCLEFPGEANRAIAKKYWETEIASGLRRYIRRHCLEN